MGLDQQSCRAPDAERQIKAGHFSDLDQKEIQGIFQSPSNYGCLGDSSIVFQALRCEKDQCLRLPKPDKRSANNESAQRLLLRFPPPSPFLLQCLNLLDIEGLYQGLCNLSTFIGHRNLPARPGLNHFACHHSCIWRSFQIQPCLLFTHLQASVSWTTQYYTILDY